MTSPWPFSVLTCNIESNLHQDGASLPSSISGRGQQNGSPRRAAAARRHRNLRAVSYLPFAAFAPQLDAGFVKKGKTLEPTSRKLATMRVQRKFAVPCDTRPPFDKPAALSFRAEAQKLKPSQRVEGEARGFRRPIARPLRGRQGPDGAGGGAPAYGIGCAPQ